MRGETKKHCKVFTSDFQACLVATGCPKDCFGLCKTAFQEPVFIIKAFQEPVFIHASDDITRKSYRWLSDTIDILKRKTVKAPNLVGYNLFINNQLL